MARTPLPHLAAPATYCTTGSGQMWHVAEGLRVGRTRCGRPIAGGGPFPDQFAYTTSTGLPIAFVEDLCRRCAATIGLERP